MSFIKLKSALKNSRRCTNYRLIVYRSSLILEMFASCLNHVHIHELVQIGKDWEIH